MERVDPMGMVLLLLFLNKVSQFGEVPALCPLCTVTRFSFISHDIDTTLHMVLSPHGINMGLHIRKQEEKRGAPEDFLGLSFSSH